MLQSDSMNLIVLLAGVVKRMNCLEIHCQLLRTPAACAVTCATARHTLGKASWVPAIEGASAHPKVDDQTGENARNNYVVC